MKLVLARDPLAFLQPQRQLVAPCNGHAARDSFSSYTYVRIATTNEQRLDFIALFASTNSVTQLVVNASNLKREFLLDCKFSLRVRILFLDNIRRQLHFIEHFDVITRRSIEQKEVVVR